MTQDMTCRSDPATLVKIDKIAARTGLEREEVCRRLVQLGLEDIEQLGDKALSLVD